MNERIIKFRAWDLGGKKMISGTFSIQQNGLVVFEDNNEPRNGFILMQFTGLLDRNGKEVYEGDIILYKGQNDKRRVIWKNLDFKVQSLSLIEKNKEFSEWSLSSYSSEMIEIIGNIYENPELLQPKE